LSLGNLSLQWATTVFGAPLTTIVAITAALTVASGHSINFLMDSEKTARVEFLLAGVIVFLVAIGLATREHVLFGQQPEQRRVLGYAGIELKEGGTPSIIYDSTEIKHITNDDVAGSTSDDDSDNTSPNVALLVALFGEFCFGFFSPAFNMAANDPFALAGGSPPSVLVANHCFSLAFTLASFAGNLPLLHNPPVPSGFPRTTLTAYWCEPISERMLAFLAGLVCGMANLLQF
jgi:hypothetical protein